MNYEGLEKNLKCVILVELKYPHKYTDSYYKS